MSAPKNLPPLPHGAPENEAGSAIILYISSWQRRIPRCARQAAGTGKLGFMPGIHLVRRRRKATRGHPGAVDAFPDKFPSPQRTPVCYLAAAAGAAGVS